MFDSPEDMQRLIEEFYPYRNQVETLRSLPETARDKDDVLAELRWMAEAEDEKGHRGQVSGSLYHGDPEHYRFLVETFGLFAHANVLQRDMYPSATKFEAEIVAMTASLMSGEKADSRVYGGTGGGAVGVLTSGGSESLITQMLTYREAARAAKGITAP